MPHNTFNTLDTLTTPHGSYQFYRLTRLEEQGLTNLARLPFSIRVMLESILRQIDGLAITEQDAANIAAWKPIVADRPNMPFRPARVVMQDFTGVPAVVDLAAMRSAYHRLGGDPARINPLVPVDLVIDHSVQVDFFGSPDALARNAEIEFQRNRERYEFLHWGQKTFDNFRVVPPATGIVHQVNLEYLAQVVMTREDNGQRFAFPDTVVGTDSHTTMINGLGVAGWGVGGIEAEAAVLGQPIDMITPEVIGFNLNGELAEGVTATDLVLTATQMLREKGVVAKFVEYFGTGLDSLSLPDRATLANMSPEYGATMGFFPVDDETLRYLRFTGRSDEVVERVERYCKEQALFRTPDTPDPEFTDTIELDLSTVEASLAGPKRPQDRVPLRVMKPSFQSALTDPKSERGFEIGEEALSRTAAIGTNGASIEMGHGAVVIAAITSCTNTSNPSVMLAAGLVARNALARGLEVKPYVKTSLAPGSRVVGDYLEEADLIDPLAKLGFNIVGYGCTTCIGNSGPLPQDVVKAINSEDLVVAAVLSGNRNFEGRIHPYTLANYLASPPLVVAYALAGTVDINLVEEPIGTDRDGNPVFLREIWPSSLEVEQVVESAVTPDMFRSKYANVFTGNETWNEIQAGEGALYDWDSESTYIQEPPFFMDLTAEKPPLSEIKNARVLAILGDSLTTDHISPAGAIPADMPAGQYLEGRGVRVRDFNTFGARRGNHEVMMRGTFGNIRLKNRLVPGVEGGWTTYFPDNKKMTIYDASMKYQAAGVPLIVLAGKEYGTGSSRDWAAKGSILLGVKAVIAQSYERIHRSNLIGMGVLPLQFMEGESAKILGLDGSETFDIQGLAEALDPVSDVTVVAHKADGSEVAFQAKIRIDTEIEVDYYRNGGILHKVLRDMVA